MRETFFIILKERDLVLSGLICEKCGIILRYKHVKVHSSFLTSTHDLGDNYDYFIEVTKLQMNELVALINLYKLKTKKIRTHCVLAKKIE